MAKSIHSAVIFHLSQRLTAGFLLTASSPSAFKMRLDLWEFHIHGSAGPHPSCKLRCLCCWVPTDLACWQLSSTSSKCTQTPGLLSLLLPQRSSFCEWAATANSRMVFPVTFAQGLDSRPAGRPGLRKRLVHWLPQPAGLRSGEEKTQRTFLFSWITSEKPPFPPV